MYGRDDFPWYTKRELDPGPSLQEYNNSVTLIESVPVMCRGVREVNERYREPYVRQADFPIQRCTRVQYESLTPEGSHLKCPTWL